jgi:hypothetical protein
LATHSPITAANTPAPASIGHGESVFRAAFLDVVDAAVVVAAVVVAIVCVGVEELDPEPFVVLAAVVEAGVDDETPPLADPPRITAW